jgi:hypothetical protein
VLPTDVEAIRHLAVLTGQTTMAAVMRDALRAYAWMVTEQRRNRRIISEDRERGDRVELMPLLMVTALSQGERPRGEHVLSRQEEENHQRKGG